MHCTYLSKNYNHHNHIAEACESEIFSMVNEQLTTFPILTTERLTLRRLRADDEQEIFILRSDREINKYLNRPLSSTISDAASFITAVNENFEQKRSLYWAITMKEQHQLIGTICLYGFSGQGHNCEIGFELLPAFQGNGVMKEAAENVIHYAFNALKVQKMEASLHQDNKRSVHLLEKLHFRKLNKTDDSQPQLLFYCLNVLAYNNHISMV